MLDTPEQCASHPQPAHCHQQGQTRSTRGSSFTTNQPPLTAIAAQPSLRRVQSRCVPAEINCECYSLWEFKFIHAVPLNTIAKMDFEPASYFNGVATLYIYRSHIASTPLLNYRGLVQLTITVNHMLHQRFGLVITHPNMCVLCSSG